MHDIPTVQPNAPLYEVLDLVEQEDRRVAVLDSEGHLAGLISDRDLLAALRGRQEGWVDHLRLLFPTQRRPSGRDTEGLFESLTAADVMVSDVLTVRADEPIGQVRGL